MIVGFGLWITTVFVPSPAPALPPATVEVVHVVDATGGSFESADVHVEEAVLVQTAEDAVECSYTSDGTAGTGEAGQPYAFQTGAREAATLGLDCLPSTPLR